MDAIGYQCLIDRAEIAVGAAGKQAEGDEQKYMPLNVDASRRQARRIHRNRLTQLSLNALHDDAGDGLRYCRYQVQGLSIHPNHARCGSQAE